MMFKELDKLLSITLEWWKKINQCGQSVLEVIVAMAIFSLIGAAMAAMAVGGFTGLEQGGEHTQAEALAQEGIEAVRAVRDKDWDSLTCTNCVAEISGKEWILSNGANETIGQYTRTITLSDVYRDSSNDIVDVGVPGATLDQYTKLTEVEVNWTIRQGIINTVEQTTYLTNWWYEDIFDISTFCVSFGYIGGTCRQDENKCIKNEEIYELEGDQYCTGGPSKDTACCEPEVVENTCVVYCQGLGYSSGICRANPNQCTNNGEIYELGGDQYCTGGGGSDTCCCAP